MSSNVKKVEKIGKITFAISWGPKTPTFLVLRLDRWIFGLVYSILFAESTHRQPQSCFPIFFRKIVVEFLVACFMSEERLDTIFRYALNRVRLMVHHVHVHFCEKKRISVFFRKNLEQKVADAPQFFHHFTFLVNVYSNWKQSIEDTSLVDVIGIADFMSWHPFKRDTDENQALAQESLEHFTR